MTYQFTALLATGLVTKDDINKFEAYMLRLHTGTPKDIKSEVIFNLNLLSFDKTSNVCERQVHKILKIETPKPMNTVLPKKIPHQPNDSNRNRSGPERHHLGCEPITHDKRLFAPTLLH